MKNRLPSIILSLTMIGFLLAACTSSQPTSAEPEEIKYADQDFVADLGKGLEARWSLTEKYDAEVGDADYTLEMNSNCVEAELNSISKYENELFEDSKLKEKALSYINCLKQQMEALDYFNVDKIKFGDLWDEAYQQRAVLISEFASNYGLSVSAKHAQTLKEFTTLSNAVLEDESVKNAVQTLVNEIQFEEVSSEYGWKEYEATVTNQSSKDLSMSFTINLLDESGVIIETTYDAVENFRAGQSAKVTFGTDKAFASTDVMVDYWEP